MRFASKERVQGPANKQHGRNEKNDYLDMFYLTGKIYQTKEKGEGQKDTLVIKRK